MSRIIIKECSEFIKESKGNPLIRYLPTDGEHQRKVKVRKKKKNSSFDLLFNTVFSKHPDLRQRCIFANGLKGLKDVEPFIEEGTEPFYVFPINGFKFMYSSSVYYSSTQYKDTFDQIAEVIGESDAMETLSEVLKYDYVSEDLLKGIKQGCEIIIYGIPYFYAVRKSSVISYSTLFSL